MRLSIKSFNAYIYFLMCASNPMTKVFRNLVPETSWGLMALVTSMAYMSSILASEDFMRFLVIYWCSIMIFLQKSTRLRKSRYYRQLVWRFILMAHITFYTSDLYYFHWAIWDAYDPTLMEWPIDFSSSPNQNPHPVFSCMHKISIVSEDMLLWKNEDVRFPWVTDWSQWGVSNFAQNTTYYNNVWLGSGLDYRMAHFSNYNSLMYQFCYPGSDMAMSYMSWDWGLLGPSLFTFQSWPELSIIRQNKVGYMTIRGLEWGSMLDMSNQLSI